MTNELFLDVVNFLRRPISQNEGAASLGTPLIRFGGSFAVAAPTRGPGQLGRHGVRLGSD